MAQTALAFGPSHVQTIEAMRGLAEVEAELGRHDVALGLLADAVDRANGDVSADERYRPEVAIARANALLRAGRFQEAAAAAGGLMPACERLSGSTTRVDSPAQAVGRGPIAQRPGRVDTAAGR